MHAHYLNIMSDNDQSKPNNAYWENLKSYFDKESSSKKESNAKQADAVNMEVDYQKSHNDTSNITQDILNLIDISPDKDMSNPKPSFQSPLVSVNKVFEMPSRKPTPYPHGFFNKNSSFAMKENSFSINELDALLEELSLDLPNEERIKEILSLKEGRILDNISQEDVFNIIAKCDLMKMHQEVCNKDANVKSKQEAYSSQVFLNDLNDNTKRCMLSCNLLKGIRVKNMMRQILSMKQYSDELQNEIDMKQSELSTRMNERNKQASDVSTSVVKKLAKSDNVCDIVQAISGYCYSFGWKISCLDSFIQNKCINIGMIPFGLVLQVFFNSSLDIETLGYGNRYILNKESRISKLIAKD